MQASPDPSSGALHSGSCELRIDGNITFANNSAVEFGGERRGKRCFQASECYIPANECLRLEGDASNYPVLVFPNKTKMHVPRNRLGELLFFPRP